jgi:hypothetical protein
MLERLARDKHSSLSKHLSFTSLKGFTTLGLAGRASMMKKKKFFKLIIGVEFPDEHTAESFSQKRSQKPFRHQVKILFQNHLFPNFQNLHL